MMGKAFINCEPLVTEVVVDAAVPEGGVSHLLFSKSYGQGQ